MGLDTIVVDVTRGGAGVDGLGWLGGDSRMGLDVDVARGWAGVTTGGYETLAPVKYKLCFMN